MDIAVSPYHLVTRDPAALAGLVLADRVVTMLPAPLDGHRQGPKRAGDSVMFNGMTAAAWTARAVPTYRGFMQSWAWTVPLWKAGVLVPADLDAELAAVRSRVQEDDRCGALKPFLRHELSRQEYLSLLAGDLLKGGPDPGLSLPVAAAIDRHASGHAIAVARSTGVSLAQRHEEAMGQTLARCVLSLPLQASARRLLHLREVLAPELARLRAGLVAMRDEHLGVLRGEIPAPHAAPRAKFREACEAFAGAVRDRADELTMGHEDDEVRFVQSMVSLRAVELPWDAAIVSSAAAAAGTPAVSRGRVAPDHEEPLSRTARPNTPMLRDPLQGRTFLGLVVKPVGVGPIMQRSRIAARSGR